MSSTPSDVKFLKFAQIQAIFEPSFWYKFRDYKLNVLQLKQAPISIEGKAHLLNTAKLPPTLRLDGDSIETIESLYAKVEASDRHNIPLTLEKTASCFELTYTGILENHNTLSSFKARDKKEFLASGAVGDFIFKAVKTGMAINNPSVLLRFGVQMYADLKKNHFYYWICFPSVVDCTAPLVSPIQTIAEALPKNQCEIISNSLLSAAFVPPAFVLSLTNVAPRPFLLTLKEFFTAPSRDQIVCFLDSSGQKDAPAWPLRNFIYLLRYHSKVPRTVRIVCVRQAVKEGVRTFMDSLTFLLELHPIAPSESPMQFIGWSLNERGKAGPRLANLNKQMDPVKLAEAALDLNLQLMRWRLVPEIDLLGIKKAKCLLLGAGTLGCNVARALLGWGVRHISFVDNGVVSMSNPARQSLYVLQDCLPMGEKKAIAAGAAMKKIFPGSTGSYISLSIPMPGHPFSETERARVKDNIESLETLIDSHDVVFLLLDSREARWLPSLLGAYYNKIVINAALGFDSFLVMRHGRRTLREAESPVKEKLHAGSAHGIRLLQGSQLGCYFCNDVVAPGDSVSDRTLDQQCTVSRPGLSFIASALAAELAVSVLLHPLSIKCTAWNYDDSQFPESTIQEWDLVCDRAYLADFINGTFMSGLLVGVFVFGHVSDMIGRKKSMMLGIVTNIIFGIGSAFSPSVEVLMALRFVVGATCIGLFTCAFVIIMEFTGGKWRTIMGVLFQFPFSVGYMSLSLLAWLVPGWSKLLLTMHLPMVAYAIASCYFIPESPRWLLNKHRIEEAEVILQRIGDFNKIQVQGQKMIPNSSPHPFFSVLDLFRFPAIRLMTVNMWYNWFTNSFVYYGLSLSGGSLVSDVYLNIILGGLVEIPAYVLTIFLLLRKGRRLSLSAFEIVGGACLLIIAVVPRDKFAFDWPIVVLAMIGKFCITASFAIIYIYSSELFPTVVRSIGVGSSSTCARVGGVIASFMQLLGRSTHEAVPVLLFGATALVAGFLTLRFPETNNRKLPETLEEAESFLKGENVGLPQQTSPFYSNMVTENVRTED
ncbi:unnamed protein product [Cyprideis torosa]|uniref:Uncharacterized protein n=1 Tax=Cyprideis torosa TaxID=163714 RepID=A0A7R8ZQB2_9CRUS|nr:unnamed protein product [Cyprideis torosa]CAG0890269.1 unnamed protein product [Cyprideis torosa]